LRELPSDHRIEFHVEVFNETGKLLSRGKGGALLPGRSHHGKNEYPRELYKKLAPFFAE